MEDILIEVLSVLALAFMGYKQRQQHKLQVRQIGEVHDSVRIMQQSQGGSPKSGNSAEFTEQLVIKKQVPR